MIYSFRKIQMAITVLLITAAGLAHGSNYNSREWCEQPCAPEFCCPENCGRFFGGAEVLVLKAFEEGLSNACGSTQITNYYNDDHIPISKLNGKAHGPDFKWNAGFRIGAGYEFADGECNVGAYWTHFNSHSNGGCRTWKLNFDAVDVLYRCRCDCSSCLNWTPFAGVKFANIDQKFHTNFVQKTSGTRSTLRGRIKEEFFGFGPLFGIEGDWGFGCGFSLYGNISVAVLYGKFHEKSHQTEKFTDGINVDHLKKHIQACQPVVDAGFGVRWKTCVCNDKLLVVQLGLEQHRYFNQNQFCGYGDLSLNGVSLGAGIEY